MDSFSSLPPHIQPPIAQVPSAIREETRLVPLILMYSNIFSLSCFFFRIRCVSSQATADWRTCHRSGDLSCRARTDRLPQPFPFSLAELQLGKSRAVENCGPPGALVEESGANRTQ